MSNNFEYVQKGLNILHGSMSSYIAMELCKRYPDWWSVVLNTLSEQRDLPLRGTYAELVDSLDVLNCLRLIDRKWYDLFDGRVGKSCRTWANELMSVRNEVAHRGQKDAALPWAERALDTMALLCAEMDRESSDELREIYNTLRKKSNGAAQAIYEGLAQPLSPSKRGSLEEGSLLQMVGSNVVQRTALTRKVTYGGCTTVYPVYRVRLDALYYNDQNDRIATWISRYNAQQGKDALSDLGTEAYNCVIEGFIVESNPDSIQKTQKNIALIGQREPGVTLADGRVVDGNRRFTCLRRLQTVSAEPLYFETVIMDMDIEADRKQIKLLELAIQHGEEGKIDYDLIDYAVGTYRDIVETKLLTIEEYAANTNETLGEVRNRLEIAGLIHEFLAYIRLPQQYHIARDYQVYSLFKEMMAPLRQLDREEQAQLKTIAFHNTILKAIPDQRKFIRDVKTIVKSGAFRNYFEAQQATDSDINARLTAAAPKNSEELEQFAADNKAAAAAIQTNMERALLHSRNQQIIARPGENTAKCINLMLDIDPRLFNRLDNEDKAQFKAQLEELEKLVRSFLDRL